MSVFEGDLHIFLRDEGGVHENARRPCASLMQRPVWAMVDARLGGADADDIAGLQERCSASASLLSGTYFIARMLI